MCVYMRDIFILKPNVDLDITKVWNERKDTEYERFRCVLFSLGANYVGKVSYEEWDAGIFFNI